MTTFRTAVASLAAALVAGAGATAHAAPSETTVRELATEAAELLAAEQSLIALADPSDSTDAARAADLELRSVDARGNDVLRRLEALDVELTEAIRLTLSSLPVATGDGPGAAPQRVVYDAAIADLLRIAATPHAVSPGAGRPTSPAVGLVVVGTLALLALAIAAWSTFRRRQSADELETTAWSDGLTGLPDRRRLDRDVESHDAAAACTAVLMIDVDRFKVVNDRFGHRYGDTVLRHVGDVIRRSVRSGDVVYRSGGEEFCVLLPGATVIDAGRIADRIVESVRAIEHDDGTNITVSVGVSTTDRGTVAAAIEVADRALHEAKHLGRDRQVTVSARDLSPV